MTATGGDDLLLDRLRDLLERVDPVPSQLLDHLRRSFCWRTVDAELAELSFDSLLDRETVLAVRSAVGAAPEARMLGFGAVVDGEEVSIDVEVSCEAGRCALLGQIFPAGATAVEVQTGGGGSSRVPVDELGRFSVEPVPSGPIRLHVEHAGRVVQTTWVAYTSS